MSFQNIAIVGAGLAGCTCAHFLPGATLFDPKGISTGTPGLFHPGTDPEFSCARDLILKVAPDAILSHGILRLSPKALPGVPWDAATCQKHFPGSSIEGGTYYPNGFTLNTQLYLECLAANNPLIKSTLPPDHNFKTVILCMGAATPVEVTPRPGTIYKIAWPSDLPPPPFSVIGRAYLTSHLWTSNLPHLSALYPQLANPTIVDSWSGVRAAAPSPICRQLGPGLYTLTGFGSHGLLHHAYWAQKLIELIS